MIFWIALIVITLLICGIAFYPLLVRPSNRVEKARDALNKAFYFNRLQEVEQDIAQGKIEDQAKSKIELQQSLLEDIPEQIFSPKMSTTSKKSLPLFVGLIFLVSTLSVVLYWHNGAWFEQTTLQNTHQQLDHFYERIKSEESDPLSDQELNQFAIALRADLKNKPQDDQGWFMLGQLGVALDDGQLALDSFSKATQLQPQNMQYKLRYAQILLFSADPQDKAQGEEALKEVIRADHTNTEALSLLAFNAFEKEDYKMAAMTWGMMLKLMPEDDPRRSTIERSIQSAMAMAEQQK